MGAGLGLGVNLLNAMLTLDLESECLVLSAMQLQLIVSCEPELNNISQNIHHDSEIIVDTPLCMVGCLR